ncbi:hypothetical protein PR048_006860 [Dryococelus australis]|uniref:Uncharacterized protein n=1 Tax=Dryococelus australis TaxID=614101 RepID=A0ABQ9IEB7_9NEOP|nr:hypothetical protein PR048_006860 [Dryococelus australis]
MNYGEGVVAGRQRGFVWEPGKVVHRWRGCEGGAEILDWGGPKRPQLWSLKTASRGFRKVGRNRELIVACCSAVSAPRLLRKTALMFSNSTQGNATLLKLCVATPRRIVIILLGKREMNDTEARRVVLVTLPFVRCPGLWDWTLGLIVHCELGAAAISPTCGMTHEPRRQSPRKPLTVAALGRRDTEYGNTHMQAGTSVIKPPSDRDPSATKPCRKRQLIGVIGQQHGTSPFDNQGHVTHSPSRQPGPTRYTSTACITTSKMIRVTQHATIAPSHKLISAIYFCVVVYSLLGSDPLLFPPGFHSLPSPFPYPTHPSTLPRQVDYGCSRGNLTDVYACAWVARQHGLLAGGPLGRVLQTGSRAAPNRERPRIIRPAGRRRATSAKPGTDTADLPRPDGNTARPARRSDEALGVRVSVARIASSLLDLERGDKFTFRRIADGKTARQKSALRLEVAESSGTNLHTPMRRCTVLLKNGIWVILEQLRNNKQLQNAQIHRRCDGALSENEWSDNFAMKKRAPITFGLLLALRTDLLGLRKKDTLTASTLSAEVDGRPLLGKSATDPVFLNLSYHDLMLFTSGGIFPYSVCKFLCNVIGDRVAREIGFVLAWRRRDWCLLPSPAPSVQAGTTTSANSVWAGCKALQGTLPPHGRPAGRPPVTRPAARAVATRLPTAHSTQLCRGETASIPQTCRNRDGLNSYFHMASSVVPVPSYCEIFLACPDVPGYNNYVLRCSNTRRFEKWNPRMRTDANRDLNNTHLYIGTPIAQSAPSTPGGIALGSSHVGIVAVRCRWSASFLSDLPFTPPFHSGVAPYSPRFTLNSSQDLDVKSRQNLSNPLLASRQPSQ